MRIEDMNSYYNFLYFGDCYLHADLVDLFNRHGLTRLNDFMSYPLGDPVTVKRGRSVVKVNLEGRTFYLKRNWLQFHEFAKGLTRLKLNQYGAYREWQSIFSINRIGIATVPVVAFGEKQFLGIEHKSFIVTEKLYGYESVENIAKERWTPPLTEAAIQEKLLIIEDAARIVRKLHEAGLNHQDLYLGHLFYHPENPMSIIDVQRVEKRDELPLRYRIKDLAQLYYSAQVTGNISRADCLRFFLTYLNKDEPDKRDRKLITAIIKKAGIIEKHTVKLLNRRRKRGEIK